MLICACDFTYHAKNQEKGEVKADMDKERNVLGLRNKDEFNLG